MAKVTYRGVEYDTEEYNASVIEESQKRNRHDLMYRGLKVKSKAVPCSQNIKEGIATLLFLCYNIWKENIMNKGKLKVLVMALKEIVTELESEMYSDADSYKQENYEQNVSSLADYDEVFEDEE